MQLKMFQRPGIGEDAEPEAADAGDEAPTAGEGADESLLGTTERDDGEMQVTYDGHPLYTFASDTAPGDTNGQGVGEVWYVVDATGKAVTDEEGGGRPGY